MYLFFHSAQTRQYIQGLVCFTVLDLFYTKPVFVLCYWGTSYHRDRRSHSHMFFKIGVLKNFANFTGKHLGWCLILTKVVGQAFLKTRRCIVFLLFWHIIYRIYRILSSALEIVIKPMGNLSGKCKLSENTYNMYVMRFANCYQSLFGVCMTVRTYTNAC